MQKFLRFFQMQMDRICKEGPVKMHSAFSQALVIYIISDRTFPTEM